MKKIALFIISFLFVGISMNAQIANTTTGLEYVGGGFYQNGVKLTADQLYHVLGQQTYGEDYVPAKNLRVAGVVCLYAGGAVCLLGSGLAIFSSSMANKNQGAALVGDVPTKAGAISGACGAVVAIAGGIMLGSANKRLKNISLASNGAGLALAF